MKYFIFTPVVKLMARSLLILAIFSLSIGAGSVLAAAETPSAPDSCGQMLADAEAQFLSTLAPDGSVPANEETQAAALEYIRVSKLCYEQMEGQNSAEEVNGGEPGFIDDGGILLENPLSAEFIATGNKWGSGTAGTAGGTVSYSFMGNGLSLSAEPNSSSFGSSVALSSLPGFQACFITDIQNAFAAWQAVANIRFVQVNDSASAFNASGAAGDIRIGAHTFDGPSGTLAHAYFPPPNGNSAAGDMHFDRAESWSCNTSGFDIGIVALHEIGHALGLAHEDTSTVAIMDPIYNYRLASLQSDDVNGAAAIYGPPQQQSVAPSNDDFADATPINSIPYENNINVTDATQETSIDPDGFGACGTATGDKYLFRGHQTVWYRYSPSSTRSVSIDTNGSSYDTYVAVWTGTSGALNLVKCNEDTLEGIEGKLSFTATIGTTYYIQVGSFAGYTTGAPLSPSPNANLKFHVTSFDDVTGDYWAWRWIEGFYDEGITTGCLPSPLRYCPERQVTRAEMAVFLLRAKYGPAYQPNPTETGMFADVPVAGKEWMQPWIEQFFQEGITNGCTTNPLRYCPERAVTRAEMAVFILRAKYGPAYQPNPSQTGIFADVPVLHKEWMQVWIEEFYEQGITTGCLQSPLRYCPERPVTRAEMAVFIDRAYNIPQLP